MIKNSTAYLIFGPNRLRFEDCDKVQRLVVLEFNSSDQQVGFNTALIRFKEAKANYSVLDSNFETIFQKPVLFSEALDEFGVVDDVHKGVISSEEVSPLFLMTSFQNTLYTYSFLLSHVGELLFLNSGIMKIGGDSLGLKTVNNFFVLALTNHKKHRYQLNNYIALYTKTEPDNEYEYKLNLPQSTDIWRVQRYFVQALQQGEISGYSLNPLRGITRWMFKNYLFEINAPKSQKGYISFIRNPNKTYIIKHKIYDRDKLKRIELRSRDVAIKGRLEDYLKEKYPDFSFRSYPMFYRQFYGFVMDSLDTGNNFGFTVDRNYIAEGDYPNLVQLEIEYYNSLKLSKPDHFRKELIVVTDIYREHLRKLNIPYEDSFYSKLSYLKDCTKGNYKVLDRINRLLK